MEKTTEQKPAEQNDLLLNDPLLIKLKAILEDERADQTYYGCNGDAVCIKSVIGVATAESSTFKRCSYNNCFGIMERTKNGYRVKQFDSITEGIAYFQELFHRNNWKVREKASQWIKGHYCTSACEYREGNFNLGISLIA